MQLRKLMAGWYRLSNEFCFSNIRLGRKESGELTTKWYADVRDSRTGNLKRYAGIWNTRRDAIEEAEDLLRQYAAILKSMS